MYTKYTFACFIISLQMFYHIEMDCVHQKQYNGYKSYGGYKGNLYGINVQKISLVVYSLCAYRIQLDIQKINLTFRSSILAYMDVLNVYDLTYFVNIIPIQIPFIFSIRFYIQSTVAVAHLNSVVCIIYIWYTLWPCYRNG